MKMKVNYITVNRTESMVQLADTLNWLHKLNFIYVLKSK